ARAVTDRVAAVLHRLDAPDVEAHRGIELEGFTTGGRLRRTEEDADLLSQLVDEDRGRLRLVQTTRDLAHRLRHESRLQTDVRVAHLALDLGTRDERRDGVDDD